MNDFTGFPNTSAAISFSHEQGWQRAGQLFVASHDEVVLDTAFGRFPSGREATAQTLFPWMSASKPVAAIAIGQLWEQGLLELDDRVTRFIPEFGQNGKESITIRHLLTHTGGFRSVAAGWPEKAWSEIVATVCAMRLEPRWTVGRKAGYHLTSSWFVLGELIQRLSDRPFSEYLRDQIFLPLGMTHSWVGMTDAEFEGVRPLLAEIEDTGGLEQVLLPWTSRAALTNPSPGRSGVGPIRELGRLYQALLNHGVWDGQRILSPQTVEAMTAVHRVGLHDHTFKHIVDWGLGFITNSSHYGSDTVPYGYGDVASRRTFGHSGYQSSSAFADREHQLVIAVVFSGAPGNDAHEQRTRRVLGAIYRDLGVEAAN